MVLLSIEDLVKIYPGKNDVNVQALRGVSLNLEKGKYYSLIGPSGSGKTTLLNLIACYDEPSAGKIEFENFGILHALSKKRRQFYLLKGLGVIQQEFEENLFTDWSVRDNILLPMRLLNRKQRELNIKKVKELSTILGIKHSLDQKTGTLSGGEAQRTSIAVALANDPELIIADEPTGNLDSDNTLNIVELFKTIIKDLDTTVLVVTHNPVIANHADIAWKITDGKISGIYEKSSYIGNTEETLKKEYTYIDDDGSVKIPEEILKLAKTRNAVEIKYNEKTKRIEFIPKMKDSESD